jgi:hypothetical protein
MVSSVSFGLDDGSTITCPDSSLLIFIDDTGHEGLLYRDYPIFGFGGCLTFAANYENAIVKPWKEVEQTFPSDILPLHASELPRARLTNVHYEAFNGFFPKTSLAGLPLYVRIKPSMRDLSMRPLPI